MIARRLLLAFCFAVAISGAFTVWINRHVSRSAATPAQLRYVATAKPLNAGQVIEPADLVLLNWPASQPLTGAFMKAEEVVGRTILYPLASGQPVVDRQVSAMGAGTGLSTRIPQGMRALSLRSDQVVGVAGYLLPGTRVDVLVTLHDAASADSVTSTVLQDAQILTAGQKMQPDPDGKANTVDVVTLLVTPADAEKVVLASSQGSVHFVLRNGADHLINNDTPVQLSALAATLQPATLDRAAPVHRARRSGTAEVAKPYRVEVVSGDKQSVETF